MFLVRIIGAVVAVIVAAVALDSFNADNDKDKSNDKDEKDPSLEFTPAEREIRHVRLNQSFDIPVGQDVLVSDSAEHPCFRIYGFSSFGRFLMNEAGFRREGCVMDCSLDVGGQTHKLNFELPDKFAKEVAGYKIVMLGITPDPRNQVELGNNNDYTAKVVISKF